MIAQARALRWDLKEQRKAAATTGLKISLTHAINYQAQNIERLKSRLKYAKASQKGNGQPE